MKRFWLLCLHLPTLILTLSKEGALLDIENSVAGTLPECLDLEDWLLYICLSVLLVPAA